MSAICGVVGLDGRPWSERDLDGVLRALAPLGRDGGGVWSGTAGRCGVGVAALLRHSTPEDLADQQPSVSEDGELVLVADLRLDNRSEVAAIVGMEDSLSVPDSLLALAAYERLGEAFLDRIVGEFALALVDRRRGGVLLARDHVGARPLVVHERRGVVAFASNALALTGLDGVGHALDMRRAAEVLALAYVSERTFVEGVRWLPPASAMWVDDSGFRRWTWWKLDPHAIVDAPPEFHERALREALDVAVAARLRSTGTVAAMVSGGLDSTSVAATAARQLSLLTLPTYTAVPPPGWGVDDEADLVRALADFHQNIAPTFVHVPRGESLFAPHEPLWEAGSGPVQNPCNFLWWSEIMARARRNGASTILSGARGNLYFSADGPYWLAALLRRGRLLPAVREAAAWSRRSGDGVYRTLRYRIASPLLPPRVRRTLRAASGRPSPVEDWTRATALRRDVAAELGLANLRPMADEGRLRDQRTFALSLALNLATQADALAAIAALTGVEERDPTSDRRVLEAASRQPEWVRRHNGMTRAVGRGAMADRLPPVIRLRTARGRQLPDWLDVLTASRSEVSFELTELAAHATSRELIDTGRLQELIRRWPDRAESADPAIVRDYRLALWRALVVSRYLRWFEQRAAMRTEPLRRSAASAVRR